MPHHQTQSYLRDYVQNAVKKDGMKLGIMIAGRVIDWLLTLAVGFETSKITSDESKDIWAYVEFFVVLTLCVCVWMMKCCCLNQFCINCGLNCCMKCFGKQRNDADDANDEADPAEQLTLMQSILQKLHMVLNRLAIGAIGFEVRKQVFKMKPLTTWDYVEISLILLFTLWILTIKYCILKCHCLKICRWCTKSCCMKKTESNRTPVTQNRSEFIRLEVKIESNQHQN